MKKKNDSESGIIVIEATIVLFLFVVFTSLIIMFIPIFMTHNKVQFALTQAANELSSYTYVYEALGIKDADETIGTDAEASTGSANTAVGDSVQAIDDALEFIETINSSLSGIQNDPWGVDYEQFIANVEKSGQDVLQSGEQAIDSISVMAKEYSENPRLLLLAMGHYGFQTLEDSAKGYLGQVLGKALVEKYLVNGELDADGYLKSMGITDGMKGLNFKGSSLFADEDYRVIDINVSYEIELWFTLIPGLDSITIEQRCATTGWLGDGSEDE